MRGERKPDWLRKKVNPVDHVAMQRILDELRLDTVCRQALCPNISECYACGQATFLILGAICTRRCAFCNLEKAQPLPPDGDEPDRVARAVVRLRLSHVVITSPTRDDLADGGAGHYAATVTSLRMFTPSTRIETLIPDFLGDCHSLETVVRSAPDIIAHNVETVSRLYHIRSGADYERSLWVLRFCASRDPSIRLKSGIMLGLGEGEEELIGVFRDLHAAGCRLLSIGQYLAPSLKHQPVQEYVPPERFEHLRRIALELGFSHVESGPYVRSSYHAGRYL